MKTIGQITMISILLSLTACGLSKADMATSMAQTLEAKTTQYSIATGDEPLSINLFDDSVTYDGFTRLGKGFITGFVFSPNEDLLIASSSFGFHFYRSSDLSLVRFSYVDSSLRCIAISPDGETLASGSDNGTVIFWDVRSERFATFEGHSGLVSSVAFSSDGEILASKSDDTVILWDTHSGEPLARFEGFKYGVGGIAYSPDGAILASRSYDTVILWDVHSSKQLATLEMPNDNTVISVSFSPDGELLATGCSDGTVILWDVRSGDQLATLERHSGQVNSVAFSPDGVTLASGSYDGTIIFWDVRSRKRISTLEGHTGLIKSIAFSPNGKILASESGDGNMILWSTHSGERLAILKGYMKRVESVAFSPDGATLLASGSWDDPMFLWDVRGGKKLSTLKGRSDNFLSVAFSPNGELLATGTDDGTVILWDVISGDQLATLKGHTTYVISVAFSPDGNTLASGSKDKTVILWDVHNGERLATLKGHKNSVQSVAFSPDGATLASGSSDGTVVLWDMEKLGEAPMAQTAVIEDLGETRTVQTAVSEMDGTEMVYIPAGTFLMGSSIYDQDTYSDEFPQHEVYLDAFWIDRTEVTNAMYAVFLNAEGNRSEGGATWLDADDNDLRIEESGGEWRPMSGFEDHPVVEVTLYGAKAYCEWTGRRLPTEAEWEKAARGQDERLYPWGDGVPNCNLANYTLCEGRPDEVGMRPDGASPYGALDMAGNVWEWVADWYDDEYSDSTLTNNPQGPSSGKYRIIRGGSWASFPSDIRAAFRNWLNPNGTNDNIGFRCATSP